MFEFVNIPALIFAFGVFVIASGMAWVLKRFEIADNVGFVALLVLPVVAYGVASGFVSKILTPGGWAAEFREIATAEISPGPFPVPYRTSRWSMSFAG